MCNSAALYPRLYSLGYCNASQFNFNFAERPEWLKYMHVHAVKSHMPKRQGRRRRRSTVVHEYAAHISALLSKDSSTLKHLLLLRLLLSPPKTRFYPSIALLGDSLFSPLSLTHPGRNGKINAQVPDEGAHSLFFLFYFIIPHHF